MSFDVTSLRPYFSYSAAELQMPDCLAHVRTLLLQFLDALESGTLRSASRVDGTWQVCAEVKQGILLAFRVSQMTKAQSGLFQFFDKDLLLERNFDLSDGVRIVPGGSMVRRGAHVAASVTIMPPAYVNVGAYVDAGVMVDSHALVGSCAQIGKNVHLSAGCQIGGVLEPVSALPVIVEDDAFVGGNTGVYEGTRIGRGAVVAAGVVLTKSTRVYDLVHEKVITAQGDGVLEIPEQAVVVAGTRPASGNFAAQHQVNLACAVIVKYRDSKTDSKAALESALR